MNAVISETLHLTAVAIGDRAVLIEGESGTGKSDLALRLIDRGARLISDDYTVLSNEGGALHARAPATIAGKIEVRGVGIVDIGHVEDVPVALLVHLGGPVPRIPEPALRTIAGVTISEIRLDGHEPSAAIKVELALRRLLDCPA